jgi:hypothetical protein
VNNERGLEKSGPLSFCASPCSQSYQCYPLKRRHTEMAKLPLITVVAPDSGPAKIAAIPKVEGGDPKGYFDTATGKIVVADLVIDSLGAGILKTDVDGNVSSNASIGHGEVDGLGALALLNSVDLGDGEVTGVLQVDKGGTGKSDITTGSLLLGAGTGDMTELAGTAINQVVKWNNTTHTWYAGTESGGGGGGGSVDSVTGTSPITVNNTDPTNPVVELDEASIAITASQVSGLATVATTGSASDITTGTLAKERQEAQGMDGDVSGTTASATVAKIQGRTISTATPENGQILVWSSGSSQWVPGSSASGGSGGGGVTYYMNFGDTDNIGTTTNIPTNSTSTPTAPPYQLGRTSVGSTTTVTSAELGTTDMEHICSFVTVDNGSNDPNITNIPAGLWDFNIWAKQVATNGGSGNALQSSFEVRVYKYSSGSVRTLLQSSDVIYIYDPTVVAQYIAQVNFPQTTILATDRIVVEIWGKAAVNNRAIQLSFNGNTASHGHTTIPSVSGTGLVKVVDGSYQTPASLLVDADVAANAAIARTKLAASDSGDKGKLLMNDASSGTIIAAAYASVAQGGLGTASNTGASGKILVGSGSSSFAEQTMGGDATIVANGTLTLATLDPAVPTTAKGTATSVATVTLNAKGLVTALTETPIVLTSTGLPAEVVYTDTAQTISGNKTFSGEVTLSNAGQTASTVLKLDGNKKVVSSLIGNADVASNAAIARDKLAVGTAVNSLIVNNNTDKKLSELAISATVGHILKSNGSAAIWGQLDLGNSDSVTGTLPSGNVGDLSGTYLTKAGNLSGLADYSTARTNLGLGSLATQSSVTLTTDVTGILPTANGGTGAGTAAFPAINTVFAGASSGSTTLPTFRSLVAADLPLVTIAKGGTNNASLSVALGTVYYGDGSKLLGLAPGTLGQVLQSQGSLAPQWAGVPYDLSAASAGTYSNSQVIFRYIAPRAVTITSTGSYFKCLTASSGTVTVAVAQSGSATTSFNVTFSVAGGTTGSVPTGTTITMAAGDALTVTMPASADTSLAGVYFTLKGTGV